MYSKSITVIHSKLFKIKCIDNLYLSVIVVLYTYDHFN